MQQVPRRGKPSTRQAHPEAWRGYRKDGDHGAQGSEQSFDTVAQYLATHFAAEVQKPLDLNTAPAVELESVAGLLRKEAAALIAHREKNGPCKKLEDLKNVAGLDYKKIEARKTRLTCS